MRRLPVLVVSIAIALASRAADAVPIVTVLEQTRSALLLTSPGPFELDDESALSAFASQRSVAGTRFQPLLCSAAGCSGGTEQLEASAAVQSGLDALAFAASGDAKASLLLLDTQPLNDNVSFAIAETTYSLRFALDEAWLFRVSAELSFLELYQPFDCLPGQCDASGVLRLTGPSGVLLELDGDDPAADSFLGALALDAGEYLLTWSGAASVRCGDSAACAGSDGMGSLLTASRFEAAVSAIPEPTAALAFAVGLLVVRSALARR